MSAWRIAEMSNSSAELCPQEPLILCLVVSADTSDMYGKKL